MVLTGNEIDGLHAIGKEAEQQAPVDSDSMAHDARAGLEADRADKSGRFSAGEPAKHGHGATRDMTGRLFIFELHL